MLLGVFPYVFGQFMMLTRQDRDGENGQLQREKRLETQPEGLSRFSQYLLNQGVMEQVMIDYLNERGVRIEWSTRAESLDMDEESVMVHVNRGHDTEKQTIKSRYVIACDGAHSWTRERLQIPMDASEEDSTWGVMDVVPITDFRMPAAYNRGSMANAG